MESSRKIGLIDTLRVTETWPKEQNKEKRKKKRKNMRMNRGKNDSGKKRSKEFPEFN
jgi:hypothetical protein